MDALNLEAAVKDLKRVRMEIEAACKSGEISPEEYIDAVAMCLAQAHLLETVPLSY